MLIHLSYVIYKLMSGKLASLLKPASEHISSYILLYIIKAFFIGSFDFLWKIVEDFDNSGSVEFGHHHSPLDSTDYV